MGVELTYWRRPRAPKCSRLLTLVVTLSMTRAHVGLLAGPILFANMLMLQPPERMADPGRRPSVCSWQHGGSPRPSRSPQPPFFPSCSSRGWRSRPSASPRRRTRTGDLSLSGRLPHRDGVGGLRPAPAPRDGGARRRGDAAGQPRLRFHGRHSLHQHVGEQFGNGSS